MTEVARDLILAAMRDAETKAWEGAAGYKFWMFGYHAARWVNYNQLLPAATRFRNPFRAVVEFAREKLDTHQSTLPLIELSDKPQLALLESEGDGA